MNLKHPELKLKLMDAVITRQVEQDIERSEKLSKDLDLDDPETQLAWKLALLWVRAIKFDDFSWMEAHIKEMERLASLSNNLERLRKLYAWSRAHPPKAQT